jgi:uncharacterized protein (TIGR02145 family)
MKTLPLLCLVLGISHFVASAQESSNTQKGVWKSLPYPDNFIARDWAATAWTGDEVLYWGGSGGGSEAQNAKAEGRDMPGNGFYFTDGWKINPKTGEFKKMPPSGLPIQIEGYRSVWTGRYLFVWGNTVGTYGVHKLYDNQTNTWKAVSATNAPHGNRMLTSLIWTGEEVFTWGGDTYEGNKYMSDGYFYNPTTNKWRKAATSILSPRQVVSIVWTGKEIVIWGGWGKSATNQLIYLNDGATYNPVTNQWKRIADNPFHKGQSDKVIWTGKECLFLTTISENIDVKGLFSFAYNPTTNEWRKYDFIGFAQLGGTFETWTGSKIYAYNGKSTKNIGQIWDYASNTAEPFPIRPNSPKDIKTGIWVKDALFVLTDEQAYVYHPDMPYTEVSIHPVFGSFKDVRDGKTYKTVTLNGQTWMAENLAFKPSTYKCYGNDPQNCEKYGVMYTSEVAQTVCPSGWRLPVDKDMEVLIGNLGGDLYGIPHLFSVNSAVNKAKGTGKSGLNFELTGYQEYDKNFSGLGYNVYIWAKGLMNYCAIFHGESLSSLFFSNYNPKYRPNEKLSYVRCIKE